MGKGGERCHSSIHAGRFCCCAGIPVTLIGMLIQTLGILRGILGGKRGYGGEGEGVGRVSPKYPWWMVPLVCRYPCHIYRYVDPNTRNIKGGEGGKGEGEG